MRMKEKTAMATDKVVRWVSGMTMTRCSSEGQGGQMGFRDDYDLVLK